MTNSQRVYEVRPRNDKRGVDLISDVLPFGRLWYGEPDAINNAIGYAKFFSLSHDAVIRVFDEAGNRGPYGSASEIRSTGQTFWHRSAATTDKCYAKTRRV
jgi:hypothetical protein